MKDKPRLLRITTVPISIKLLLQGQPQFFQQQGFEVLTVSADGPEVSSLKEQGINHFMVHMTRTITPVQDLISLFNLVRIIRKFNPHIVHTHTPKAGLLGMIAAWLCHVPVRMHTVAGLPLMEASGLKRIILKLTERITYRCASHIFPNSKGLFDFIKNEFNIKDHPTISTTSKFKIIGKGSSNGINTILFQPSTDIALQATAIKNKYGIEENIIVFSFVGRIVKDKGIVELVNAFKQIATQHPARLFMVGHFEQDLDPLPQEVFHFLQHDPNVVLAGFQSDVRPWISASDIFVFPSYREGFPNVVMQACCLRVPAIVSDINGCNEIIQHEKTGLIVPPKHTALLYEAMDALANDKNKQKILGYAARNYVVDNFDQQYVWRELLKEYRVAIGQLPVSDDFII